MAESCAFRRKVTRPTMWEARPITEFFYALTPGDEKAIREAFKLDANPALEDVHATPNGTGPEAAELMERVRDSIKRAVEATNNEG